MCTTPYRLYKNAETGKWCFAKNLNKRIIGKSIDIGCGQCLECLIKSSREWAVRIMCDMETAAEKGLPSSFLTLTYEKENMPTVYKGKIDTGIGTLSKKDINRFTRVLRESLRRRGIDIRYYAAGEYGDVTWRPHYHVALIGYNFPDKYYWSQSKKGHDLYRSEYLESIWFYGASTVQELNCSSAEYVTQDVVKRKRHSDTDECKKWLKKLGLEKFEQYYDGRVPEFSLKSTKPGLGAEWCDKYGEQMLENDISIKFGDSYVNFPRYFVDRVIKNQKKRQVMKYEKTDAPFRIESKIERRISERNKLIDDLKYLKNDPETERVRRLNIQNRRQKRYQEFKNANIDVFSL